jgi:hypothetical protein
MTFSDAKRSQERQKHQTCVSGGTGGQPHPTDPNPSSFFWGIIPSPKIDRMHMYDTHLTCMTFCSTEKGRKKVVICLPCTWGKVHLNKLFIG